MGLTFLDVCSYCKKKMVSPYTYKDESGNYHHAHRRCITKLKLKIESEKKLKPIPTPMVDCKYRIEFGCCDGRLGAYLSDTIEQLHKEIDSCNKLEPDEKEILKYGYFGEFRDFPYTTKNYVIDSGLHVFWIVRSE